MTAIPTWWLLLQIVSLDKVYDIDDPHGDHTGRAIELDESGDTEGAIEAFKAAVR
jgi:hypothetical protein